MDTAVGLIVGVPLGAFASFMAWFLVTRLLVPSLDWSDEISVTEHPSERGRLQYRIKVRNAGRRDVINLQIVASIKIRGPHREGSESNVIVDVPLSRTRVLSVEAGHPRLFHICAGAVPDVEVERLPWELREALREKGDAALPDILSHRPGTHLIVRILAQDRFSGASAVLESPLYGIDSLVTGRFKRGGLAVASSSE